jgi:hypothetical protein
LFVPVAALLEWSAKAGRTKETPKYQAELRLAQEGLVKLGKDIYRDVRCCLLPFEHRCWITRGDVFLHIVFHKASQSLLKWTQSRRARLCHASNYTKLLLLLLLLLLLFESLVYFKLAPRVALTMTDQLRVLNLAIKVSCDRATCDGDEDVHIDMALSHLLVYPLTQLKGVFWCHCKVMIQEPAKVDNPYLCAQTAKMIPRKPTTKYKTVQTLQNPMVNPLESGSKHSDRGLSMLIGKVVHAGCIKLT